MLAHQPLTDKISKAGTDAQHGVAAIETGGRLLTVLAQSQQPMKLRDLATAAQMAPAKAHRYLVSLIRIGLASQDPDSARYDIGPLAIRMGLMGVSRLDVLQVAQRRLPLLRDQIQQTVALSVWGNDGPIVVRWLTTRQPVAASLREGSQMPLTRSATGRAFACFEPDARVDHRIAQELESNHQQGLAPATAAEFETIRGNCRRYGVARVEGDLVRGINSVAAPIFDAHGDLALVATALGHAHLFNASWRGDIALALRKWCDELQTELGSTPAATHIND